MKTTNNKNQNNTQKRVKPTPVSLVKTYEGVSICEVITDLIMIDTNIANVFFVSVNDEDFTRERLVNLPLATVIGEDETELTLSNAEFDDMVVLALDYASTVCAPQLLNKRNIHCSCSVASNRFYIRTEAGFSINVEAKYHIDKDNRFAVIDSYTATYTNYKDDKAAISNAEAYGYEVIERKPRNK